MLVEKMLEEIVIFNAYFIFFKKISNYPQNQGAQQGIFFKAAKAK